MVRIGHTIRRLSALLAFLSLAAARRPALSPADVFDPGRAHTIHVKLSADGWDLLQPGAAAQKMPVATNGVQGKISGVRLRAKAPASYAYVQGEIEFDGRRIPDVGLRFKGNSSYSV